jgi:hypothetical protein
MVFWPSFSKDLWYFGQVFLRIYGILAGFSLELMLLLIW